MTPAEEAAIQTLVDAVLETSDLVDRYQEVKEVETALGTHMKEIKADITKRLYEGRSWSGVGDLLGVTGSRAEQISRGAR
ncbi:hypothetical protein ACWDBF_21310 [Streptomyces angustmyceticus]